MAITAIDLHRQGQAGTLTNAEIAAGAAIALSKLAEAVIQADGGQAFTGDQSLGGFKLTSVGTPTAADHAVNKSYADALASGVSIHDPVRAATTANITLSGAQTIDGVAVVATNRVLVKNQTAGGDNGIYVAAAGAWARAADMDISAEAIAGIFVFVAEGTVNADSGFVLTTDNPITLGTTALTWVQFSGAGQVVSGAGMTKTGNTLDVGGGDGMVVAADGISVNLDTSAGLKFDASSPKKVQVALDGSSLTVGASGLKVNVAKFITRETPSGSVNSANVTFTLASTPIAGSESVYLNGLLQEPGAGNDYTISTGTITYLTAPVTGDRLRVSYVIA
jgi:phage-related tail fiber protein